MTSSPNAYAAPLDTGYSILDGIIAQTRLTPQDDAYDIAKRGCS